MEVIDIKNDTEPRTTKKDVYSIKKIRDTLVGANYIPDYNITTILYLSLELGITILVEGPPGLVKPNSPKQFPKH